MASGTENTVFPQYDYGQGNGAWNPSSYSHVYRKMEYARFAPAFALIFCMDVLFGKERSGDSVYFWAQDPQTGVFSREKTGTKGNEGNGWLYNNNTLNASKSGVPRVFGPPAAKTGGAWRYVVPCTTAKGDPLPSGIGQFTFVVEGALTGADAQYTRLLDAAHVAFTAIDHYGTLVCVPYAAGWEVRKRRRGRPECDNSKTSPIGSFYQ